MSHELQPEGQLVPESGGIRLLASAENEITCRLPRLIDRAHERVVAEAFSEIIEECPAAHDWRVDCRDLKHLPVLLLGAFELGRDVITGAGNSFTLVLQTGALPLTILERVKARFLCIID